MQISFNLALGSALATIGLTIPAVAATSIAMGLPLTLGLPAKEVTLLALTLLLSGDDSDRGTSHSASGSRTSRRVRCIFVPCDGALIASSPIRLFWRVAHPGATKPGRAGGVVVLTGSAAPPDMRFWVRLFKMADHYLSRLDERLSKRQAQTHRAAAAIVRRTNTGSVARCGPSCPGAPDVRQRNQAKNRAGGCEICLHWSILRSLPSNEPDETTSCTHALLQRHSLR